MDLEFSHAEFAMPMGILREQLKMDLKFRKRSDLNKDIWGVCCSETVVEVIDLDEII